MIMNEEAYETQYLLYRMQQYLVALKCNNMPKGLYIWSLGWQPSDIRMHAQGLQPDVVTCNLTLESLCQQGKTSAAWELVENMEKYLVLWISGINPLATILSKSCVVSDIIFLLQ